MNTAGELMLLVVEEKDYDGVLEKMRLAGPNPIQIEWLSKQPDEVVQPSVMQISAYLDDDDAVTRYHEMALNTDVTRWRVTLYRGATVTGSTIVSYGTVVFRGLLNAETLEAEYINGARVVRLPVGDALSTLKYMRSYSRFDPTNGTTTERQLNRREFSVKDVVTGLLYDTNLNLKVRLRTDARNYTVDNSFAGQHWTEVVMVPRMWLKDKDRQYDADALRPGDKVLAELFPNHRIYQVGDTVYIDKQTHVQRASSVKYVEYDYDGTRLGWDEEASQYKTIGGEAAELYLIEKPTIRLERRALKSLTVTAKGEFANLIAYQDYANGDTYSNLLTAPAEAWHSWGSANKTVSWRKDGFDMTGVTSWSWSAGDRGVGYAGYLQMDINGGRRGSVVIEAKYIGIPPQATQISQAVDVYVNVGFLETIAASPRWFYVGGSVGALTFGTTAARVKAASVTLNYGDDSYTLSLRLDLDELIALAAASSPVFNPYGCKFFVAFDPLLRTDNGGTAGSNLLLDTKVRDVVVRADKSDIELDKRHVITLDAGSLEEKKQEVALIPEVNTFNIDNILMYPLSGYYYPNLPLFSDWYDDVYTDSDNLGWSEFVAKDGALLQAANRRYLNAVARSNAWLHPGYLYRDQLGVWYMVVSLAYKTREDAYLLELAETTAQPVALEDNVVLTPGEIAFGAIGNADYRTADLQITNNGEVAATFTVKQTGDTANIYLKEAVVWLDPGETKTLTVIAEAKDSNKDNAGTVVTTTFSIGSSQCVATATYGTYAYTIDTSDVNVGTVSVGHSVEIGVSVQNTGTAAIGFTPRWKYGNRGYTYNGGQVIVPGGTTLTIQVGVFTGAAAGTYDDVLIIVNTAGQPDDEINHMATVVNEPKTFKVEVIAGGNNETKTLHYANTPIGNTVAGRTVRITNKLAAANTVTVKYDNAGQFVYNTGSGDVSDADGVVTLNMLASEVIDFELKYKPVTDGWHEGALTVSEGSDEVPVLIKDAVAYDQSAELMSNDVADSYPLIVFLFSRRYDTFLKFYNKANFELNITFNIKYNTGGEDSFSFTSSGVSHSIYYGNVGVGSFAIIGVYFFSSSNGWGNNLTKDCKIEVFDNNLNEVIHEVVLQAIADAVKYLPLAEVTPNPVAVGTIQASAAGTGAGAKSVAVAVKNTGSAQIDLDYSIGAGWTVDKSGETNPLPAGATSNIVLKHDYDVVGQYDATLSVFYTGEPDRKVDVPVTFEVLPAVNIGESGFTFTKIIEGVLKTFTVVITNNGNGALTNLRWKVRYFDPASGAGLWRVNGVVVNNPGQYIELSANLQPSASLQIPVEVEGHSSGTGNNKLMLAYDFDKMPDDYVAATGHYTEIGGPLLPPTIDAVCIPSTYDFGTIPEYHPPQRVKVTLVNIGGDTLTVTAADKTGFKVLTGEQVIAAEQSADFWIETDMTQPQGVYAQTIDFVTSTPSSSTVCSVNVQMTIGPTDYNFTGNSSSLFTGEQSYIWNHTGSSYLIPTTQEFRYDKLVKYSTDITKLNAKGSYKMYIKNGDDNSVVKYMQFYYDPAKSYPDPVVAVEIANISQMGTWNGGAIYTDIEKLADADYSFGVSPGSLSFNHVNLNVQGKNITITNNGNATISVVLFLTNTEIYNLSDSLLQIGVGQSKTVTVMSGLSFIPVNGTFTGVLTVTETHGGGSVQVSLQSTITGRVEY